MRPAIYFVSNYRYRLYFGGNIAARYIQKVTGGMFYENLLCKATQNHKRSHKGIGKKIKRAG
jgi:hypothetical protein